RVSIPPVGRGPQPPGISQPDVCPPIQTRSPRHNAELLRTARSAEPNPHPHPVAAFRTQNPCPNPRTATTKSFSAAHQPSVAAKTNRAHFELLAPARGRSLYPRDTSRNHAPCRSTVVKTSE